MPNDIQSPLNKVSLVMPSHRKISPLPPDVTAKIRSSTSIIHLNGVVMELVKNGLDAGARTVFVSVDFKRGSCIVEDDGDGIPQAEFEPYKLCAFLRCIQYLFRKNIFLILYFLSIT